MKSLFALIWVYLILFYPNIPFWPIFSLIYLYFPLFGFIYLYVPTFSLILSYLSLFDLSMSSKVKCYKINWKETYDLLYMFHTNFDHTMYSLWDTTCWNFCDSYLTFQGHLKSKVLMQTENLYMNFYICFIETLLTASTVSEILARIE